MAWSAMVESYLLKRSLDVRGVSGREAWFLNRTRCRQPRQTFAMSAATKQEFGAQRELKRLAGKLEELGRQEGHLANSGPGDPPQRLRRIWSKIRSAGDRLLMQGHLVAA